MSAAPTGHGPPGGARYWAFLSYSHADRRVAARLHRALESYRLPPDVAGQPGRDGPVPPRLHPVFRDRAELGADAVLGEAVNAALSGSRALVVLCSPDAAASPWVDAEATAFARLRPGAPVLCVLLADAMPAGDGRRPPWHETLPPSLRARFAADGGVDGLAPVAVDLRPGGDGWRLGVLKLVAGLAGVPLDRLVRRDASRRHQRLAWLTGALGLAAGAFALLAWVAVQSRDAARAQRLQAEGLVEFMLGDLRDRLEPVGRLDALEGVGARALAYYESQDPKALDDASLARRAAAQRLIGEIDARRGDDRDALEAFRNARATTAELLARRPGDADRIYDHAQSVFWVGYHAWQRGEFEDAERAMHAYRDLAGRLVEMAPGNVEYQVELASAHSNLGVMLLDQGRVEEAIVQFERARRIQSALPDGDPANALLLGQGLSWLSTALSLELRLADATATRREEIALYEALLSRDPRHALALERMALARRFLAELLRDAGDATAARREAERSAAIAEAQLVLEPDNADWQLAAAKAWLLLARFAMAAEDPGAARAGLEANAGRMDAWRAERPDAWAWQVEVPATRATLESDLARAAGDRARALAIARSGLEAVDAAIGNRVQARKAVQWRIPLLGRIAELQPGDPAPEGDRARAAWSRVVEAAGNGAEGAEAVAWSARAWAALGDGARARAAWARLREAGYDVPLTEPEGNASRVAGQGE